MRVSLITYDQPHKKTQDVLFRLLRRDCFQISLTLLPFKARPAREPQFNHRPEQMRGVAPLTLAKRYALEVYALGDWRSFYQTVDYFLVCGSGLIDPEFCREAQIINCHPGLIPQVRGLDAFKWCIYQGWQLGNTLHRIDEGVDLGAVFHHEKTDVFANDDLDALAARHYDAEIDLVVNFDRYLKQGNILSLAPQPARKRMPSAIEAEMLRRFESYKRQFAFTVA